MSPGEAATRNYPIGLSTTRICCNLVQRIDINCTIANNGSIALYSGMKLKK